MPSPAGLYSPRRGCARALLTTHAARHRGVACTDALAAFRQAPREWVACTTTTAERPNPDAMFEAPRRPHLLAPHIAGLPHRRYPEEQRTRREKTAADSPLRRTPPPPRGGLLMAINSHSSHQPLGNNTSFTLCSIHILFISNEFHQFWMSSDCRSRCTKNEQKWAKTQSGGLS